MKEKMSSTKAWLILGGLFIVLPWLVLGVYKYWSVVYNVFY